MAFTPESSKDLNEDLVNARDAAVALRSELYNPTVIRLLDDQVKLVQREKDAQEKYWDLAARQHLQKQIMAEHRRKGSINF